MLNVYARPIFGKLRIALLNGLIMKKVYLMLGALLVAACVFGQSISIVSADENPYAGSEDFVVNAYATIKNVGSSAIDVRVKRVEEDVIDGTLNYFCWKNCYDTSVYVSPDIVTMNPGDESAEFSGYYEADRKLGTSTVRYVFFDNNNPNDSADFTVNYLVTPMGVQEVNTWSFLDPYPNPANDQVVFEYRSGPQGVAKVVIFDMLGNERLSGEMEPGMSRLEMNTLQLEPGIYFYVVSLNDNVTITKKLVISRN